MAKRPPGLNGATPSPATGLGSMAVELLDLVFAHIRSTQDLLAVACTCRRFHQIIEPQLYSSVTLRSSRALQSLHDAITARPERAGFVRSFAVKRMKDEDQYRFDQDKSTTTELSDFCLLPSLGNLEELRLDTYWLDSDEWFDIFRRAARGEILQSLRSCSLLFCDPNGEHYNLGHLDAVFLHPTLKILTIANAKGGMSRHVLEQKPCIGLQRLELLESDISVYDLKTILSIPRTLKELTIHATNEHYPPAEQSPQCFSDYDSAITEAASSLMKLTIVWDPVRRTRPMVLRKMLALRHVALDYNVWFGPFCEQPKAMTEQVLQDLLPPQLELMEVQGWVWGENSFIDEPLMDVFRPMFNSIEALAPNLKRIHMKGSHGCGKVSPEFKDACDAAGVRLTTDEIYGDEEEDEEEEERGWFIPSADWLSLPISYVD